MFGDGKIPVVTGLGDWSASPITSFLKWRWAQPYQLCMCMKGWTYPRGEAVFNLVPGYIGG